MRRALVAAALAGAAFPSTAAADGLPIADYGLRPDSIEAGNATIAALPAGGAGTVVARIRGDRVAKSRFLPGRLAIPAVAYDGTAGGASVDGSVLTLIEPRTRFPRRTTDLTLLGRRLKTRQRIHLDGDFSFDAIAPDGSALYLVEYPNPRDPAVYRVRVYDTERKRLRRKPLLDSRVATVVMRGLPITRATGPGGRVAYTLYDGFGEPFIHALDTVERSALCILLPKGQSQPARDPMSLRLDMGDNGRELVVSDGTSTLALVDTESNTAARPPSGLFGTALTMVL